MANRNVARAVRLALIAAGTASAGMYVPGAVAQEAELEQVVVTGSRIVRQDFSSTSPIVSVTEQVIQQTGIVNAEKLVNTLPQVVPSFSAGNNNPGGGQAYINLRGLGSVRNLVLVDGKRMTPSNENAIVDINNIPTRLIERVEVISGGASAVYGSDAVAGAVNFILKDNFEGFEFGAQYGTSDRGDADNYSFDWTVGSNFADDRGNAVLFASYDQRDELSKGDRAFSKQAVSLTSYLPMGSYIAAPNSPSQAAVNALFAGYGATGAVTNSDHFGFNADGTLFSVGVPSSTQAQNFRYPIDQNVATNFYPGRYSYNFEPWNKLIIPQERVSVGALGSYEVNSHLEAYTRVLFTNYSSATALAPSPAPTSSNSRYPSAATNFVVPVTNPFIPNDLRTLLASRTGNNAGLAGSGPTEQFLFRRRFVEVGPREESYENDVYQVLAGLRGDIVGSWKYDVYFGHGKYNNQTNQAGNVRVSRVQDLLESPTGGTEFCAGGWNPFGQDTLSKACADYVGVVAKDTNRLEQNLAEAVVNGDLFALPAGNVSLAAGAFYQEQDFKYLPDSVLVPDPATGAADVSGFNAAPAIAGYVNNLDYFGEIYVPIVSDLPLMKLLAFTGGYRFSDHSNSGGSDSYKGELDWQMTDGFRVRGSYQRAVRAPNIGELYSPPSEDNPEVTDPCNADSSVRTGPNAAAARSLCLAQGMPTDVINTFSQGTDQIDALQIGNEDLDEETADTYTVGLVWQSTSSNPYAERLSASIDYYDIKIDGVISFISPLTVVNRCFNQDGANPNFQLDNFYCNLFGRDVTGNIQNLQEILINQATLATTGIDFQVDYGFPLGDRFGDLGFNFVATYVDSFESKATADSPTLDYKGTIGASVGEAIPEWKGMLTTTWTIADVTTALTIRYIDAMEHENSVDFGTTDPDVCECTAVDSMTYLDASVNWDVTENFGLRLGVENLTDEDPQLYTPSVDSGTDPSVYDVIGRRYFLQGNFKF